MNITTSSVQVLVDDSESSCGVNINRRVSGYVADLHLWGDAVYLAKREGSPGTHILIAPSDKWEGDIADSGFEIIGKLSDLSNT